MIEIGKFNTLEIIRETENGFYLGDETEEVLLPNKYIDENWVIGDNIKVFVYLDSMERKVATTEEPLIIVGEFAGLEVAQNTSYGSFLEWGITKQLFVPFDEQSFDLREGKTYAFYMYVDKKTNRLVGSARLNKFFDRNTENLNIQDKVGLLVANRSDLGYKVVVNNKYEGLIFNSDVSQPLKTGQLLTGYIKKIRPDGKLDISIQKPGYRNSISPNTDVIMNLLKNNDGFLGLNDKSSPDEIRAIAKMSKKNFKKAVGALYKQKIIAIKEFGIELIK